MIQYALTFEKGNPSKNAANKGKQLEQIREVGDWTAIPFGT